MIEAELNRRPTLELTLSEVLGKKYFGSQEFPKRGESGIAGDKKKLSKMTIQIFKDGQTLSIFDRPSMQ